MPDWHPYEDYTKAYYARKDLGGGVALSLIHEIHLVLELAGLPTNVFGEITKYQKLNLDVDVCSDLMIKHKSGAVSQVHLDFLQRPTHRSGLVTFEKAWLAYDLSRMVLTAQRINEEPCELFNKSNYDSNDMYIDQLKEFIRLVEEGRIKHQYDAQSSLESLKVVEALFKSNKTGKKINEGTIDNITAKRITKTPSMRVSPSIALKELRMPSCGSSLLILLRLSGNNNKIETNATPPRMPIPTKDAFMPKLSLRIPPISGPQPNPPNIATLYIPM